MRASAYLVATVALATVGCPAFMSDYDIAVSSVVPDGASDALLDAATDAVNDASTDAANDVTIDTAPPTCTAFSFQGSPCNNPNTSTFPKAPDQFCIYPPTTGMEMGIITSTPSTCRCMETYDCACVVAVDLCPAGMSVTSCSQASPGQLVIVRCQ